MTKSDCSSCRFFIQNPTLNIGSCRRYPVYQNRHGSEWCGEHALAHYDLPDTIDNLVAAAEKEENWGSSAMTNPQFIAEQNEITGAIRKLVDNPKNKGGRPRKVTRI